MIHRVRRPGAALRFHATERGNARLELNVRALRRIGIAIGVLAIAAIVVLYAASDWLIRRPHDVELKTLAVTAGESAVAEGRRLAIIRGCNDGCHGKGVAGGNFFDGPWYYGGMVAPDLTRIAATHSDAELERVIRRGVRQDVGGRQYRFARMHDEEVQSLYDYLTERAHHPRTYE